MKTIKIEWGRLEPISNILNEVCNGLKIENFNKKIGFSREETRSLLVKIMKHEAPFTEWQNPVTVDLDESEIQIIENSINEVLNQIDEWEFHTRIDAAIPEVKSILNYIKTC
jgi:uncharacterized protein YlzI (FlbEa/FlbD family)